MGRICYLCRRKASKRDRISLHKFPENPITRNKWIKACDLSLSDNLTQIFICSLHFDAKDIDRGNEFQTRCILKFNAIPSVNVPNQICTNSENINTTNDELQINLETNETNTQEDVMVLDDVDENIETFENVGGNGNSTLHNIFENVHCKQVQLPAHALKKDVICSRHFSEDAFDTSSNNKDKSLKEGAIPTENLPRSVNNIGSSNSSSSFSNPKDYTLPTSTPYRYEMIRTAAQLKHIKDANEKLQKQVHASEIEIGIVKDKYKQQLVENTQVRNELKKYAQHVFSKERTKAILSKVFSQTQIKVLMGKKKTYWSDHDMAVAYTIRHLSSISCYNYLVKNMNIPLPGLSSIKRWINVKSLGKKRVKKENMETNNDNMETEEISMSNIDESEQYLDENDVFAEDNEANVDELDDIAEESE